MKPSLFILGVLAAIVCIENPLRRKVVVGARIWMAADTTAAGSAGLQHCNNAWPRCVALAETARLVRIMSRRATPGIDWAILIDRATAFALAPAALRC
jgi:hypothetical protein